jgi:hypothetical protein
MKFKEHYQKAMELRGGSASWYREKIATSRADIMRVKTDRLLSPEGRQLKAKELQITLADQLIRDAHARKLEYVKELQAAKKEAESVIKQKIKRPDDEKVSEFESLLGLVKTEIMLATNFTTVETKLNEIIAKIDEPFFAEMLAKDFGNIIPQALAIAPEPTKAKLKLSALFNKVNTEFLPDDVKEAKQILDFADNSLANPNIFPPIVKTNAAELFGTQEAQYLFDTDAYMELVEKTAVELDGPYAETARQYFGKMPTI